MKIGSIVAFDCDPAKANHLKSLIYKEIEKIVKDGPTAVDLDKSVKNMLKTREQSKLHNKYWFSLNMAAKIGFKS